MAKAKRASRSRLHLDDRFKRMPPATQFAPPIRGWIRAIRNGLGMTSAQLAKRLGIAQPSVIALEQSEAKGTMELGTLRRVAEALDCTVVYALIPRKPLETIVRERARLLAVRRLSHVEHSMLLENQKVSRKDIDERLDEFIQEMNPSLLWDES